MRKTNFYQINHNYCSVHDNNPSSVSQPWEDVIVDYVCSSNILKMVLLLQMTCVLLVLICKVVWDDRCLNDDQGHYYCYVMIVSTIIGVTSINFWLGQMWVSKMRSCDVMYCHVMTSHVMCGHVDTCHVFTTSLHVTGVHNTSIFYIQILPPAGQLDTITYLNFEF